MVSSAVKKYAALCMVCLCSSLFFLGLYQFNNKYSQNTIQAANGILALSEEELQKSPVRFLVSGWAFYPDALLTPEEIRDESHYMRYLSIGETNFSALQTLLPMAATYQMTFFLPERKGTYALEIPSIFCLQPLSGSGDLILQMGTGTGTPLVQTAWSLFMGKTGPHHSGQQLRTTFTEELSIRLLSERCWRSIQPEESGLHSACLAVQLPLSVRCCPFISAAG